MDKYEKIIEDLCYQLTEMVYLPIRNRIRKLNEQLRDLGRYTESYDFGYKIEKMKMLIETGINSLKE